MYAKNYEELRNRLINFKTNRLTYYINKTSPMLPFTSRENERVTFNNGSLSIIGASSRAICGKDINYLFKEDILDNISTNEYFEISNSDDEFYMNSIIKDYLGADGLNIIHPSLFLYIPLSEGEESKGEIKFAQFLKEIFFNGLDFEDFFKGDKSDLSSNILIEFIISNLKDLKNSESNSTFYVPEPMEDILNTIKQDLRFLLNHKEFLLKNFDLIISYYLYFYFVQFTLKFYSKSSSKDVEKTFYLLDWEMVSKNRLAVSNGYNIVGGYFKSLLIRMNMVEQLNSLFGENNLVLSEMYDYFNDLDDVSQKDFLKYLKLWIEDIRITEDGLDVIDLADDFEGLVNNLNETITESYNLKRRAGPVSRYPKPLELLGKKYFLKRRGRYGFMFNMSQEILMLITAICIQEDKIRITNLFEEYEKRGIFFDRESINQIIKLFNKLNLLDKKSDSGDVQYVKSIL